MSQEIQRAPEAVLLRDNLETNCEPELARVRSSEEAGPRYGVDKIEKREKLFGGVPCVEMSFAGGMDDELEHRILVAVASEKLVEDYTGDMKSLGYDGQMNQEKLEEIRQAVMILRLLQAEYEMSGRDLDRCLENIRMYQDLHEDGLIQPEKIQQYAPVLDSGNASSHTKRRAEAIHDAAIDLNQRNNGRGTKNDLQVRVREFNASIQSVKNALRALSNAGVRSLKMPAITSDKMRTIEEIIQKFDDEQVVRTAMVQENRRGGLSPKRPKNYSDTKW